MDSANYIRLAIFLGLLITFMITERIIPRRSITTPRGPRWFTNLSLNILSSISLIIMAIGIPLLAIGAALDAKSQGWGLFNLIGLSGPVAVILTILLFDFAIWFQHMVFHKIPILWRLHRVHHADIDMDVTTAIRFHPVEIMASMLIKISLVYIIGAPALGIFLFEIFLNGTALFSHSNIRLSSKVDHIIRKLFVTPDMHLVHHSVHRYEHDSNYGFALSIWDRIFKTYRAKPDAGVEQMKIGLQWQNKNPTKLGWCLWLPFKK